MVSNDEISQKLKNKREGNPIYLVCDDCGGYYELKPDESPENFDIDCDCGGQLVPSTTNTLFIYSDQEKDYGSEIFLGYALLLFGGIFAVAGGLYLISRDNERAKLHGKIILGIAFGLVAFVFLLWGFIAVTSHH